MTNNALVQVDNEVRVKIGEEIITLKPEIVEKLTINEQSFFRGALDFYNNETCNEKKPIDLSLAPFVHRFNDLIEFLEIGFCDEHSLCECHKPEELFELAEYLGILPDDSLDKIAYMGKNNALIIRQQEEQMIFEMAKLFLKSLNQRKNEKFKILIMDENNCINLYSPPPSSSLLFKHKFLCMDFDMVRKKFSEKIKSRLIYMNYFAYWGCKEKSYSLHLEPAKDWDR